SSRRVKQGVELLTTVATGEDTALFMSEQSAAQQPSFRERALFADSISHKSGRSAQDIAEEIAMASRRREAAHLVEASADEYLKDNQVVNAGIPQSTLASVSTRSQTAAERYGLADVNIRQTSSHADISHLQEELAEMRLLLEEQLNRLGAAPPGGQQRTCNSV